MNRRSFLQALGLSVAVVALSPMLDLAPIEPVMSAVTAAECNTLLKDIYAPMIADQINLSTPLYEFFRNA